MSLLGEASTERKESTERKHGTKHPVFHTGCLFGTGRLSLYVGLLTGCLFGQRHLFEPGVYTVKYGTSIQPDAIAVLLSVFFHNTRFVALIELRSILFHHHLHVAFCQLWQLTI